MRQSTEPTENIRPRFGRLGARIAKAKQIKIVRSEMRIIEPDHDQHCALPRGRRPELISPSAAKLSER